MPRIIWLISIILLSAVSGQGIMDIPETQVEGGQIAGVEIIMADRDFSSLKSQITTFAVNIDYPLIKNTVMTLAVGANQNTIPLNADNTTDLTGKFGLYGKIEAQYNLAIFYSRGAVGFYKTKGSVTETSNTTTSYVTDNNYTFIEYPLETGINLKFGLFDIQTGLNKTFLYGTNQQSVKMVYHSGTTDLGEKKSSFIDQLPLGLAAGFGYQVSSKYSIRVKGLVFSPDKYQVSISIWSKVLQTVRL